MSVAQKIRELEVNGYCVLRAHLARPLIDSCREAFWPILRAYVETHEANRGLHRHFLPMPFEPPCFHPEFFFDTEVLSIVRAALGDRIAADQWGCDIPLPGSDYQSVHIDYQRPLFSEAPELMLPAYMLVVSFGLIGISKQHGPVEIAAGTHRMPRTEAMRAIDEGEIRLRAVPLEIGDVLIRHPWALHRGTPNTTCEARALVTIRYVRSWYFDNSREVNAIPRAVWESLTEDQRNVMRFPVVGSCFC